MEDSSRISDAPIIYFEGFFYVFGGTKINKLNAATHVWSKAGDLNTSRYGHNVIFDGRHFLVVGGRGTKKTEQCTITHEEVTCVEQAPQLTDYAFYPELFLVPGNICEEQP